ncbi:MAG TPA: hypothetical protein VKY90_12995 [Candidatus Dormibacteraeota bacterium]|nr:hypothetical protein [Candidatus Dormibacteraeota bacterium]
MFARGACARTPPGSELSFVAAAAAAFVVCLVAQYLGYGRLLLPALRSAEAADRRRALRRWLGFVVTCEGLVVAAAIVYAIVVGSRHPTGIVWALPPIAALVGVSLPLQLAASRLARSAFRE